MLQDMLIQSEPPILTSIKKKSVTELLKILYFILPFVSAISPFHANPQRYTKATKRESKTSYCLPTTVSFIILMVNICIITDIPANRMA